jgi:MFS family permease
VLLALSIFTIFSIACGFAQSITQLIAFRFLQGVGGAGMYALALIVIVETATLESLPMRGALIGMTVAIAGVLGPVVGGQLTAHVGWR